MGERIGKEKKKGEERGIEKRTQNKREQLGKWEMGKLGGGEGVGRGNREWS